MIVIGRQYGSGGREIGRALATRLGIPYYDRKLLREAAVRIGFDEEVFSRNDEQKPSLLASLFGSGCYPADGEYTTSSMSRQGLYRAQSAVIAELAKEGPCVIVGRTADYVLRDHPRMASIFIHAPIERRVERIMQRDGCDTADHAAALARKRDSAREKYYNFFTGRHWGHADNYHLSIDASSMTTDEIVDLIVSYLEHQAHWRRQVRCNRKEPPGQVR